MARTIGIDLGTTNSCVAVFQTREPEILENSEGGRTTPSVVAFSDAGERLVGAIAKRQAVANPERTISSIKRLMGRKLSEVSQFSVPYKLTAGPNDSARIEIEGREYAPQEISAMIIRKLREDASDRLGEEVDSVVVTVPAYFNDDQRQATKEAVKIAGLKLERIINEPTAAALAYGLGENKDERVLVFDLGGGTFDVSILDIGDGVFDVQATAGDNLLGGNDWDLAIVEWILSEFEREHGLSLRGELAAMQRVYEAAEKAKIELSNSTQSTISLPFLHANNNTPLHLERSISRSEMLRITNDLLRRLSAPLYQALSDAGGDVDHVILVGGMTRMPAVQEMVEQVTGITPRQGVNPDEAVAAGAAIQAAALSGQLRDVLLLDVTPLSLGVETRGGLTSKLIERNTTIPTQKTEIFSTSQDNQNTVEVHVLQGEREMSIDNKSLGRFRLEVPPAPVGVPKIEVSFDIDVDGIISVAARNLDTGEAQEITISGGSALSNEDVEAMLRDASDNADRDRERRNLAEARNARDTAIYIAQDQLEQMNSVSDENKKPIEEALQRLRALDSEDPALIRSTTEDLQKSFHELSVRIYKAAKESYKENSLPSHSDIVDAEVLDD